MPGTFTLEIVTPERLVFQGEVTTLQAPGLDGLFGVLHNRAPLLAGLGPGAVTYTTEEGETKYLAISGGFFEVAQNKAVLLADTAQFGEEISPEQAAAELTAAKALMLTASAGPTEQAERQAAAQTAQARVAVATKVRR
ncbi:MAG: ATP synthase F1 subunit epsilon [Armatimonadetes bacterium]|nr:ATP synthase F1 subunit epsilon [Armatimonadota bacterium]